MKLAVIPARGGSKRIPKKNVRDFCGRPMLSWSISAALESGCFSRVVVSTDDDEIAATALAAGAEVPFMRPSSLSDDYTGTIPVIRHAIEELSDEATPINLVCCIYATAPFVRPEDIRSGLQKIEQEQSEYAFSVTSYPFPIQRAIRLSDSGRISMFQPEHFNTRSQDLEEAFHDAGQFYWGQARAWIQGTPIFADTSVPVILPRHRVQDIDTPEDWERAEWLFRAMSSAK